MVIIDEKFMINVGRRLRKLREDKGFTRNQVVDILSKTFRWDIDEKSIRRHEKGEHLPKLDSLIYIAELYDTTIDYILYGKETSDDNSYTWYDNFKRLNRLLYTMDTAIFRDERNNVCIKLLDHEANIWFNQIENLKNKKEKEPSDKITPVADLDNLFTEFKKDTTQIVPIEERRRRDFLSTKPCATITISKKNGKTYLTTEIDDCDD